ncbi:FecR domain-containing protein [Thalassospira sp. MA62]|nr:FecR domain-containing protein [Thalassospira sp. MA62]
MNDMTHPDRSGGGPYTASDWIARLAEDPENHDLRDAHDAWLHENAQNQADWDETLAVWQMLEMTVPAHSDQWEHRLSDITPAQERVSSTRNLRPKNMPDTGNAGLRTGPKAAERTANRSSGFAWRKARLGGAFAIVLGCLLFMLLPGWITSMDADFSTKIAQSRDITLADGSVVHLAPDSALSLDDGDPRKVTLLEGEAFFEVTPDASHPFVVTAGHTKTTVLGTAFNVRNGATGVDVMVEQGHVRVQGDGASIATDLHAGDGVLVHRDGQTDLRKISPDLVGAWRNGQLIAKDHTLADMVAAVDRYYDGWIMIPDDDLATEPLTGFYDLSDPMGALRAMADAQGAEIRQVSPWVSIILSK